MLGRLWTHKKFSALVHGGHCEQDSKEWLSLVQKHQDLMVKSGTEEMCMGKNRRISDSAHYRFGFYSAREGRRWKLQCESFRSFVVGENKGGSRKRESTTQDSRSEFPERTLATEGAKLEL